MTNLDRWLGAVLVLVGMAIAATARGFTVGFLVDPVGPRALPYLVAALLVLGGGALLVRRTSAGGEARGPASPKRLAAQGSCVAVLLLYAATLPLVGFVPSTVVATGALARLFGGRWLPGLAVGLAFGLGLYGLFAYGLSLELPVGLLFGNRP